MIGRFLVFSIIYIPFGLVIAYFLIQAEDQGPWLIAFIAYFLIAAIFGNLYVFTGGRRRR